MTTEQAHQRLGIAEERVTAGHQAAHEALQTFIKK